MNEQQAKSFSGTWKSSQKYGSEVKFQITIVDQDVNVVAVDHHDGEKAEVRDVGWDGQYLIFQTYWFSTGRICDCRMNLLDNDTAEMELLFSEIERLEKEQ